MKLKYLYQTVRYLRQQSSFPSQYSYYLKYDGKIISFWNDLPINIRQQTINVGIEIPKENNAKFQLKKNQIMHPLIQDIKFNKGTKKQELRYYAKFPLCNYGFVPQTWQQTIVPCNDGLYGDNDPIDVCQLGEQKRYIGEILKCRVLGAFCLIDQGQIDWKVLAIEEKQAKLKKINKLQHINPLKIQSIMDWFKCIKVFDGKQANTIRNQNNLLNCNETIDLIHETHQDWLKLMKDEKDEYKKLRQKYVMLCKDLNNFNNNKIQFE